LSGSQLGTNQRQDERIVALESSRGEPGGLAQLDGDGILVEAQRPPGGGVSGIASDPVNVGDGGLAMFPTGDATSVQFSLYDPNLDAAGNLTGPNATTSYLLARPGLSVVSAESWAGNARARLRCVSSTGDDTGDFIGQLLLTKDDAALAVSASLRMQTGSTAIATTEVLAVLYDGRVQWSFFGGGTVALIAALGVPDNAVGDDGDWALGGNGHLYFKAAGAWVEKL
jgi:hypothetical protein